MKVHIIGCGTIGSYLAIMYMRKFPNHTLNLWDFDTVEQKNMQNQAYRFKDIGKPKTEALKEQLLEINPNYKIKLHGKYENQNITGLIFTCADSIKTRLDVFLKVQKLTKITRENFQIIDVRIGQSSGQVFSVSNQENLDILIKNTQAISDDDPDLIPTTCGTVASDPLLTFHAVNQMLLSINNAEVRNIVYSTESHQIAINQI